MKILKTDGVSDETVQKTQVAIERSRAEALRSIYITLAQTATEMARQANAWLKHEHKKHD